MILIFYSPSEVSTDQKQVLYVLGNSSVRDYTGLGFRRSRDLFTLYFASSIAVYCDVCGVKHGNETLLLNII